MSAIDSYTHAHVGNFFGLPIYWVFEESKLSGLTYSSEDEVINKYFLSIGGGGGEHPALILNNDAVLLNFIRKNVQEIEEPEIMSSEEDSYDYKMYCMAEQISDRYLRDDNLEEIYYWVMDTNQWPLETFIRINDESKKYNTEDDLENKIMNAVALFIIYEMPIDDCIKDEELRAFAKMYREGRWQNVFDYMAMTHKFMGISGILECQKAGKIIRDGKVVWGYSLNDWKRDNILTQS